MEAQGCASIGGKQVVPNQYTAIRNPATGDVVGHAAIGDTTHLDRAIAAAEDAFNEARCGRLLPQRRQCPLQRGRRD